MQVYRVHDMVIYNCLRELKFNEIHVVDDINMMSIWHLSIEFELWISKFLVRGPSNAQSTGLEVLSLADSDLLLTIRWWRSDNKRKTLTFWFLWTTFWFSDSQFFKFLFTPGSESTGEPCTVHGQAWLRCCVRSWSIDMHWYSPQLRLLLRF